MDRFSIAVVASTITFAAVACRHESPVATLPLPVHTAVVQMVSVDTSTKYSANIVPYAQVDLSFKSNGYVERSIK